MTKCSHCGATVDEQNAAFCAQCGAKLDAKGAGVKHEGNDSVPAESALMDEMDAGETLRRDESRNETEYIQTYAAGMADGAFDAHDQEVLADAQEELRITPAKAIALEQQARESLLAETPRDVSQAHLPVGLEINDNHFYMENKAAVLDLRLTSVAGHEIDNIRLSAKGNYLGSEEQWRLRLSPGASQRKMIQMCPTLSGENVVDLALSCEVKGELIAYTAQVLLKVLGENTTPASVTLVIDQRQDLQAGRNIGYGLSIHNEVKEGVAKGLIRTANDLLMQPFPDSWSPTYLARDEEKTQQFREDVGVPIKIAPGMADRVGLAMASLRVGDEAADQQVLLLGLPDIRMGRSRGRNDIVLRVMPRSEQNDPLSLQIQVKRPHLVLSLRPDGLVLVDRKSANGTELDGQPVHGEMQIPLDRPSEIDVGMALRLRLFPFVDDELADGVMARRCGPLGEVDELWRMAEGLKLRSVLIERQDGLSKEERYLIVYRWAHVGRGAGNEVLLPGSCSERKCIRILRVGRSLWLEALSPHRCLLTNDTPIPRGSACPLLAGMKIGCDQMTIAVGPFKQLGL